jgi:hypothetical protein
VIEPAPLPDRVVTVDVVTVIVVLLLVTVVIFSAGTVVVVAGTVVAGTVTTLVLLRWAWTGWKFGIWAVAWLVVRELAGGVVREVDFDLTRNRPGVVAERVLIAVPEPVAF